MNKLKLPPSKLELLAVYLSYAFRYLYPLVLVPYYGRVLGTSGYGVVLAGMSLCNTVWMFVGYGFSTIGSRDIVHAENDSARDPVFREQFTARLVLCVPGIIIGLIAAYHSELLVNVPGTPILVVFGGVLSAFNIGWYFMATGRAQLSVMIEVLGFIFSSAMVFTFIHHPGDLTWVFPLMFTSITVQLVLAYVLIRREIVAFLAPLKRAFDLIKRSTIIFVYGGTSVLLIGASAYILSLLAPPSEVSAFGVSERLVGAALSLMGPASQILLPKVMYLVGRDDARANLIARRIFTVFFVGAVLGVIVTKALSGWLIPLVFGAEFSRAVPVLNLLVMILPISVCNQVLGLYFLIPRKLEGMLARCALVGAVLSVGAAVPFARYFGAMGMAEARLLGETSLLVMLLFGIWRSGMAREIFGAGAGEDDASFRARFIRWFPYRF